MKIPEKLTKPYNAVETEDRIYKIWQDGNYFLPDSNKDIQEEGKVFSIVLPPPNVTGTLHMGHASVVTIEDIMVRYNRMNGAKTLWIPGTDHAAIATQSKVEGLIYKKEGLRRHDLGREELLRRVNEFAQNSHDTIVDQVKKIGASIDWSREAYTLDETRNFAVRTAFKKMYDDGLIYRGYRVINWDPKGQTTVSDEEVLHQETKGKFYTFKYSPDFPISIATTRPETKIGDTAVAVHPTGKYKEYIGKEYDLVFAGVNLHIKIIGDDSVDETLGTGAVGVTPAHSQIDWEMSRRHDLPIIPVINDIAKMAVSEDRFSDGDKLNLNGKKTTEAREIIVAWLKEQNLLEKEEEIEINLSTAERTGGTIEPLPKLQWFIAVNKKFTLEKSNITGIKSGTETTLKELMLASVKNKQIEIIPDRFEKIYYNWIENLRDWCISRQIWFGHQIPIWYRGEEIYCGIKAPEGSGWEQDPDTLDTWFSSGLWSFSTLGWPNETEDFKTFHPLSVMETAYDIIFFWVARMILMTTYLLGDIPFRTIYLHGLVKDSQGRKMSKSLGNVIDPLKMTAKYGTDAVRISLIIGTGPGNDTKLSEDKIRGYKHFANKLWNIARFVITNSQDVTLANKPEITEADQKNLTEFTETIKDVTEDIEKFRFYLAGEKLYHYTWHTFADIIIEEAKVNLANSDEKVKLSSQYSLIFILSSLLKLLHPFIPFVTEEIWGIIKEDKEPLLIVSKWPKIND